jgi:hypothetical protein
MITDEMVEVARRTWLELDASSKECWRAALEAVAPMLIADYQRSPNVLRDAYDAQTERFAVERPKLIAQGMMEADDIVSQWKGGAVADLHKAILNRLQELDPK